MVTVICNECGRVWTAAVILGENKCPECGSKNISAAKWDTDEHRKGGLK